MLRIQSKTLSINFPKQQIFGSSKLKEFGDESFECKENGVKKVDNTVGKGEIARSNELSCRHAKARAYFGKG